MPRRDLTQLPDDARLWVFVSDRPIADPAPVLDAVDAHLDGWAAHGVPLVCARDWRDAHFLAIAVDEKATGASGCSIDGLFRTIARAQGATGADLLASGRVAWRDASGAVRVTPRMEFERLAAAGDVSADTPVFETLVDSVGGWRARFEVPAVESWARALLP